MRNWITSQNRKVSQRKLNAEIRKLNKNIEKDLLWHGRFIVRQDSAQWFTYPREKDYWLWVVLKFIDKKTNKIHMIADTANHFLFINGSHIWHEMNHFIIDICDVWAEGHENLWNDNTDYTKIKI